jgi:hypothetical protein
MKLIFGIICILLIGSFSGCLKITSQDDNSTSNSISQPWKDGTISLLSQDYSEEYSPQIGDYRTADIWINVDYDVYINTEIGGFELTTSNGKIMGCDFGWNCGWNCEIDGKKYGSGSTWGIPFSQVDSPGNFSIHITVDGQGSPYNYNLKPDETIAFFTFQIYHASNGQNMIYEKYTIPINENLISK